VSAKPGAGQVVNFKPIKTNEFVRTLIDSHHVNELTVTFDVCKIVVTAIFA
jgi:hypothetical protein